MCRMGNLVGSPLLCGTWAFRAGSRRAMTHIAIEALRSADVICLQAACPAPLTAKRRGHHLVICLQRPRRERPNPAVYPTPMFRPLYSRKAGRHHVRQLTSAVSDVVSSSGSDRVLYPCSLSWFRSSLVLLEAESSRFQKKAPSVHCFNPSLVLLKVCFRLIIL